MMKFRYKQIGVAQPVFSLGGRTTRPRPLLFISVTGPTSTKALEARVDSGSDETLCGENVANQIGVDLTHAPVETAFAANQGIMKVRMAQVTLRISDGIEFREWPAKVGFVAGLRKSVLGFGGFLQFFKTTLHGDDELVELEVNRLYPGT
jgi:hypothetical protein